MTTAFQVSRIVEAADSLQYKLSMPSDPLARSNDALGAPVHVRLGLRVTDSLHPTGIELWQPTHDLPLLSIPPQRF